MMKDPSLFFSHFRIFYDNNAKKKLLSVLIHHQIQYRAFPLRKIHFSACLVIYDCYISMFLISYEEAAVVEIKYFIRVLHCFHLVFK